MWILRTRVLQEFTWAAWMLLVLLTNPKMMPLVTVNGTAKRSGARPSICLVDFGINENAYFFRVVLPGMRRSNESNLSCDIERDGTVRKKGVAAIDAGILRDSPRVFHMCGQQLCPPGPFTVSFQLPGGQLTLDSSPPISGKVNGNEIQSNNSFIKLGSSSVSFLSGA
ncbi:hypothetical protein NC653_015004 [Populus alba x Populus x berolinensis]|uniref:SHSP domain-containing protein n=1 Tax=Populus alba x Populus x berolinensis TaxID=444605 RepID=A0AAD6QYH9_9ROSI|nr:hypothetical protein NC653_015004 [Populus alba x Populus x berolinensis]